MAYCLHSSLIHALMHLLKPTSRTHAHSGHCQNLTAQEMSPPLRSLRVPDHIWQVQVCAIGEPRGELCHQQEKEAAGVCPAP